MIVHIFRGPGRIFGMTTDEAGRNLPGRYAPWTAFKTTEMFPDEPYAGVDVNTCLQDIETHGYHITDAHRRITHLLAEQGEAS